MLQVSQIQRVLTPCLPFLVQGLQRAVGYRLEVEEVEEFDSGFLIRRCISSRRTVVFADAIISGVV